MHALLCCEKRSVRSANFLLVQVLLLLSISGVTFAGEAELSADAIAEMANMAAYYPGLDSRARVHISITNSRGKTRQRDFTVLHRDEKDGGDQDFYVFFQNPPDVRAMA